METRRKMKTDTSNDCYGYMRLTHTLAICWGLPFTRRRMDDERHDRDCTVVQGHRYTFDRRVVPVWLVYAALDMFVAYYNYWEATNYVGVSFKTCFEESYCVAVIELVNRNLGPSSVLACLMLLGRRHKEAALAGTERTLAFLRDTGGGNPSSVAKYYSVVVLAVYWSCIWMYAAAVPATVVVPYVFNALTQTAVYNLILFQYYVLERGFARVNLLLQEAVDVSCFSGGGGDMPATAARSLARLADAYDDLGRLVDHLNHAYVLTLMVKWPYSVVRLIMVVLRIIELSAAVRASNSFARVATVLIVEHVFEILLFLLQLSYFCAIGNRLTEQINIFWVRVNARKVNATVGGFIMINMDLMKGICGIIATYFLVLIQFEYQKGNSKPLHQIWD